MPKTKSDNRTVEIKMGDKLDRQAYIIISGIKLKSLPTKKMTGTNQLFQVLGETQLENIFQLAEESLKMPAWKYNDECYLKDNDKNVIGYAFGKSRTDGDIGVINVTKRYALYITYN